MPTRREEAGGTEKEAHVVRRLPRLKNCLKVSLIREGALYSVVGGRKVFRENVRSGTYFKPVMPGVGAGPRRLVVLSVLLGVSIVLVLAVVRWSRANKMPPTQTQHRTKKAQKNEQ